MLTIKKAEFIISAADKRNFLVTDLPVIAVCGRSNVGKSSFINMLANRNKLAKTSSEPGRTRLVNYFDFGDFILADLPGYGFARVGKAEKEKWRKLLDEFFEFEGHISHVFALADVRHEPSADDLQMVKYLYAKRIPFSVIATKADKVAKTKVKEYARRLSNSLGLGLSDVISTSAQTRLGKELVLEKIEGIIQLNKNGSAEDC